MTGQRISRVMIIGAGPAGMAAALQVARQGITPLLLERGETGGLLRNAHRVENYPGFPGGVSGRRLAGLFRSQLEEAGVVVSRAEVVKLDYREGLFVAETAGEKFRSRTAVVATGTRPLKPEGMEISPASAARVFYEVAAAREVSGEEVAVVGAGDAAFDYALYLSERNRVTVYCRGEKRRCLPVLWERCRREEKIRVVSGVQIDAVGSQKGKLLLEGVTSQGKDVSAKADSLFLAVGREPAIDFLSKQIRESMDGLREKKILYLAGDVKNGIFRQTAISVGDGIRTAMEIGRYFSEEDK
ncbi:MAG: NAD(P)/FAD-dependent oxidoreductase [Candidatus Krumholzibacteriota bacterium]|nr:NAD(P)/FAD-dependent oxidoreductase [Candidatus Krumholzibacteriota bacterium]